MSQLPQVIVTDYITEPLECERRVLAGHAEVHALNARTQADLNHQLDDADAVMIYHFLRLERSHIERLKKCRIIVRPGVGYDNIDIAAARERGIPVCNVPDYGTEEVADSAMGMALALARGIRGMCSRPRRSIACAVVSLASSAAGASARPRRCVRKPSASTW
jgi:C-terminal binding protein